MADTGGRGGSGGSCYSCGSCGSGVNSVFGCSGGSCGKGDRGWHDGLRFEPGWQHFFMYPAILKPCSVRHDQLDGIKLPRSRSATSVICSPQVCNDLIQTIFKDDWCCPLPTSFERLIRPPLCTKPLFSPF